MMQQVETVIVGGGHAGLAVSYMLGRQGREHLILERGQVANSWREERWDSFRLVIPNRYSRMPGMVYDGDKPDGFMAKDEIISTFDRYLSDINPPLVAGVTVTDVSLTGPLRFLIKTDQGTIRSRNVVVATGPFHAPKIPLWSSALSSHITQLHTQQYKNPKQLPDGGVLITGSGQSGVQIAEELLDAGHRVFLCVGSRGWLPRRYLGKDITTWYVEMGLFDTTIDTFPSLAAARASGFSQLVGDGGLGHDLNIHTLAQRGVTLLGRAVGGEGHSVYLGDLVANLEAADTFAANAKQMIDEYKEQHHVATQDAEPWPNYPSPQINLRERIDLRAENIRSVVWAGGYKPNYDWLKIPVFDDNGYPRHQRGITQQPGLFFTGLEWLYRRKSSTLMAGDEDAKYIAAAIANGA